MHFPRDITPPSEGEFPYHVHQSICSGVLPPFCLSTPPEGEQKHKEIYSPSKGGTATKPTDSEYFVIVHRISYLCSTMADNYLERRYDEYLERKAAAEKAKRTAWKKRLDAYRKRLAEERKVR